MNRGAGSISAGLISQHRLAHLPEGNLKKRAPSSVLRGDPVAYRREYQRVKGWPKEARRAHLKAWRATQPGFNWQRKSADGKLAQVKAWQKANRGLYLAMLRDWRARNPGYSKKWRDRNPGYSREYYSKNAEALRAYNIARYDPEKAKRATCACGTKINRPATSCIRCYRASIKTTPAAIQAQNRIHNAKRNAVVRGSPAAERIDPFEVFRRCGWRCEYCGEETPSELRGTHKRRAPELDHRIAVSRGGTHTIDNVTLACRLCNTRKRHRTPEEFVEWLATRS